MPIGVVWGRRLDGGICCSWDTGVNLRRKGCGILVNDRHCFNFETR